MNKGLLFLAIFFVAPCFAISTNYVSLSGSHVPPFDSWATAATNIQDAVDVAVDGDSIFVADGTYHLDSEIVVDKNILIQSVNGQDVTVVDGQDSTRCFNLGSNACVISGFTIQNGVASREDNDQYGGGVRCADATPVVTNCIIECNGDGDECGRGGGVFKGTVRNCVIRDNIARFGGGFYGSVVDNCVVSLNVASIAGGGGSSGEVSNSRIVNNCVGAYSGAEYYPYSASPIRGGGLNDCATVSCEIINNTLRLNTWQYLEHCYALGGGVYGGTVHNSLILGNKCLATREVGQDYIYAFGGGSCDSSLYNCTVVSNLASEINSYVYENFTYGYADGGGARGGIVYNSILQNNFVNMDDDVQTAFFIEDVSSANLFNSCLSSLNPQFIDEANGDYHLATGSPCINWGNNAYTNSLFDLDGNNRVVEDYVDMGCYEYQSILGLDDSDDDGLPDDWEHQYFGGNVDPNQDPDGDGHLNWQEQISGMDPTDGTSVFAATDFRMTTTGGRIIEWPYVSGRYYSVYWKEDLQSKAGWIPADMNIESGIFTDTVHGVESAGFYKLEVGLEPIMPPS